MTCNTTDFQYPLLADVFYPIIEQGAYGNVSKQWVLDKTIPCFFGPAGRKFQQQVGTESNIVLDNSLVGRVRIDITVSEQAELSAITNILITNIRDAQGNIIYNESSGVRVGKATIFEIATITPIVGPFGSTEYYKVVIRRSENQAVDV